MVVSGAVAHEFSWSVSRHDSFATCQRRYFYAYYASQDDPEIHRLKKLSALPLWFPDGGELVEGLVDLVFEEDGGLVVVDYKTDGIAAEQSLAQAAHHAPQLQLYGRGLAQALGLPVRQRLVLFTALGEAVPV